MPAVLSRNAKEVDAWPADVVNSKLNQRAPLLEETTGSRNPVCALPSGTPLPVRSDAVAEAASGSMETPPSPDQFEEVVYPQPETSLLQGEDGLCHASEIVPSSSRSQGRSGSLADADIDLISLDPKGNAAFGRPRPKKEDESFSGVPETGHQGETNPDCFLPSSVDQQTPQSHAENFKQSNQRSHQNMHASPPQLKNSVDRPLNMEESGPGEKRKPKERTQQENMRDSQAKKQGHQLNESTARHTADDAAQTKGFAISDQKTSSTGRRQKTRSRSPQQMINTRDPECEMKNSISQRQHVKSPTEPQHKAKVEERSRKKSIPAHGTKRELGNGVSRAVHLENQTRSHQQPRERNVHGGQSQKQAAHGRQVVVPHGKLRRPQVPGNNHRRLQDKSTRFIAGRHGNVQLQETGAQDFRSCDYFRGIPVTTLLQQFMNFLVPSQQRFCRPEGMPCLLRTLWESMRAMGITVVLQSSLDRSRHRIVIQRSANERIEVLVDLRQGLGNITPPLVPTIQAAFLPALSALSEIPSGEDLTISPCRLGLNLLALPGISSEPHQNEQIPFNISDGSSRPIVLPVQESLPSSSQEQASLHSGCISLDHGARAKNAGHGQQVFFLCRVCLERNIEYIHDPCGHGTCCDCCQRLEKCHMCKGAIKICLQITKGQPPGSPPRNLRPRSRSLSPVRGSLQPNQAPLPFQGYGRFHVYSFHFSLLMQYCKMLGSPFSSRL